jgi:superfamily II DNA or RNA helicase
MLYEHQKKYASGYKDKELVVHEMGTGKTICACVWLKDKRDDGALVICPKRVIEKWRETLQQWNTKATVVSMEQFKKLPPKQWSALVVDEVDEFASPLFTKNRSQRSTALYNLIKTYPEMPMLGMSATPIRSSPANLHTLLCFRGVYIPWKKWRDEFYSLERRPFIRWAAWFPKSDWREHMRPILEKYADIVLMKDCVDFLPAVQEETIMTSPERLVNNPELGPSAIFSAEHRNEQSNKAEEILKIAKGFRKVLVVAYYVGQVEDLAKKLGKDRQTFAVYGKAKEQEKILKEAERSDECFLIVQASLGAGFDADSFSCVVFASMSFKVRDYVQMKGRVRRIKNLHPVIYYYLIGGKWDKRVRETIELGKEFIPSEW